MTKHALNLHNLKGKMISFEGADGSGKTTIINKFIKLLQEHNIDFYKTREPGGTEVGELIRSITSNYEIHPATEALLFAASRNELTHNVLIPTLNKGTLVICDRFLDSSLAYQGEGRGLGLNKVLSINEFAIKDFRPDITILLDIDPSISLKRIHDNNRASDILDTQDISFYKTIRECYLSLANQEPERFIVLDASQEEESLFNNLIKKLSDILN